MFKNQSTFCHEKPNHENVGGFPRFCSPISYDFDNHALKKTDIYKLNSVSIAMKQMQR